LVFAGYRLSPLHLGRLDDLLGMGLPVPLTSSNAAERTPVSATGPAQLPNEADDGKKASLVEGSVPGDLTESTVLHGEPRPMSTGSSKPVNGAVHAPATSTSPELTASGSHIRLR
jgi:hypothetical protein